MIYLFDKDEKLIKIVRKSAVKTALQKYALTTERYVSDRLTVELKGLNADELEQVEYMAIQTMEDAHTFHYFYVAQKSSDELTTLIGVQSGIEELRKSPVYDKRPQNAFARDVITDLLTGTNWQARFVGETTPHSTNFYYTSVFDALKKVCEVWDLEMQFFVEMNGNRIGGRYIDFKRRIGEAVGKRVVYGHNALQILQEVERTNIFTALIGRGKGEETGAGYGRKITFEDVTWSTDQGKPVNKPAGQKYLELPLMTQQYGIKNADGSMRPKIGFVDFSEEENPEILIERTYRALVDAARPQLTLKTSSVYLKGVKIGDTIRVVRHDKKLDYDTRIFEITFNRLNNQSSDIKLGDRIGESNEAKVQTIADKAVEQFITNEFSTFVQNLPNHLPSADGFNNNWYGAEDPTVQYPGKVLINDIWFKPDPEHEGHQIMLRWTGEVWEEILRTYESEALRDRIAEEIAQVTQSMQAQSEEHDRQVTDILSKTQSIESLANQAKTDAASALARANQVKTEAIADARAQVATVNQALNTAKTELQSAIASADQKARDSQASATALRNDLNLQAQTILTQAQAQTALTSRVSTVETLADGTKTTVTELSKTVNKATGDIASVTSRTKTVEDTLSQTRTQYEDLTQTVNTQTGQIESINRKTADLQSGIDGVTERFESLRVGGRNLIPGTASFSGTHWEKLSTWRLEESLYKGAGILTWVSGMKSSPIANISVQSGDTYTFSAYIKKENAGTVYFYLYDAGEMRFATANVPRETLIQNVGDSFQRFTITFRVTRSGLLRPRFAILSTNEGGFSVAGYQLESGSIGTDWSPAPEDLATVTALHNVTDTVDSHTRTIGAVGTAGSILDNVSKVTQTAAGLVAEVSGTNGLKTQVSQLAGSYAIKNLTKAGDVLGQINLNPDGSVRINEGLISVGTKTYIQDSVITSAKIAGLDAGKITTGTLDAARIKASSIDGSKLVFDQAFFTGLTANEAYLEQLFAKDAFITQVQAVSLSAEQVTSGILQATNKAVKIDLNNANITFNQNATINFNSSNNAIVRRKGTHTAFVHFNDVKSTSDGGAGSLYASIGVTSSGDGINSESSGRFAGLRAFRGAYGTAHGATVDQTELYGDKIIMMDDFKVARGFIFRPDALSEGDLINMNNLVTCVRAMREMWAHYKNSNGTLSDLLNNRSNYSVNVSWKNMHGFK